MKDEIQEIEFLMEIDEVTRQNGKNRSYVNNEKHKKQLTQNVKKKHVVKESLFIERCFRLYKRDKTNYVHHLIVIL